MLFLWVKKSELPWNASLRVLKKHGLFIHVKAKPQPAGKPFSTSSRWQHVAGRSLQTQGLPVYWLFFTRWGTGKIFLIIITPILFQSRCGYLYQLLRLMTINSSPANAMIVRNGVSADFGVVVVSGRVVTIVDGTVFGKVVLTGTGVVIVQGQRVVWTGVSVYVTSGIPTRS